MASACAVALAAPSAAGAQGVVQTATGAVQNTLNQVVPTAPTSPVPPIPPVPGAPPPVNDAINTVNGATGNGSGGGGSGGGGSSSTPSGGGGGGTTSHSTGSGPTANGGSTGTHSTGGGAGTGPRTGGTATGGRSGGHRATHHPGGTAAAGGGASTKRTSGRTTPPTAPSPHHKKASTNPVSRVINRIEQIIPGPVWALIAALALLALAFAGRSQIVARRARRLERQRQELLGDVGLLQRALLPDVPDGLPGIQASVAYRPAEGPAAGGDFYDVFELDEHRTAFIVGDVCGHGRQALAVTALMRYTLRAYIGAGFEPRIALQVTGRTVEGQPDSELTTVVLAIYDSKSGTLTYACAGHEPPILLGPAEHEPVTVYSSPPVGGPMTTGHRQTTVSLPPGSSVCFFTDGLVEARLGEGMIGRERLAELVTELDPDDGAQFLLERLAAKADRAPDDMAACLVRTRADAVSGSAVRVEEIELDASDLADDRAAKFFVACGMDERSARAALASARAKAVEFGGVVMRVLVDGAGVSVETSPRDGVALPVPLLADVRRRALRVTA